jgi:predicted MPP superfamily phosphohydrolase
MELKRRNFLRAAGLSMFGLAAAAGTALIYGVGVEPASFEVTEQRVHLPRLVGEGLRGLRVAQISDIHMGGWMNLARFKQVTALLLARKPDLVVITGDFLLSQLHLEQDLKDLAAGLENLTGVIPVFSIMGNHDHWHGIGALRSMLADVGVQEIRNSLVTLKRADSILHVAGVDDVWEQHDRLDLVLKEMPPEGSAILLAHEPDFADTASDSGRFDLQLSGHSHGGQIVLPLLGPPILPRLGEKYPSGFYRVGKMLQYTNRGVGMASLAMRFNCPPEISLFTLI